jgi:hypothetical protein
MYNVIRKFHLWCGLIVMTFLMMYAVSGAIMTHRPWFNMGAHRPAPTVQTVPLDASIAGAGSKEQLAADVQRHLKLDGRIQFPQSQPSADDTRFWVNHPGTELRVDVLKREKLIRLTTQREPLVGKLIMLHKVNGYDAHPAYDAVALFADLTGVTMILFAFTGVYLWWKTAKNRLWGVLCLAASCAYGVGMMLYFAFAP